MSGTMEKKLKTQRGKGPRPEGIAQSGQRDRRRGTERRLRLRQGSQEAAPVDAGVRTWGRMTMCEVACGAGRTDEDGPPDRMRPTI